MCTKKMRDGIMNRDRRRDRRNNGPPSICVAIVADDDAFHRFRVCSGALSLHVTGLDIDAHRHVILCYILKNTLIPMRDDDCNNYTVSSSFVVISGGKG